jgi:hypothetical protein
MRRGPLVWTVTLVLGMLLWLTSLGPTGPAYRSVLVLATLSWFGYVVWVPKRN